MPNLNSIKARGIERFLGQQKERIRLVETMIVDFDDGRSRSYYCKSGALLDLTTLENSLTKAIQEIETHHIKPSDTKTKARILKSILGAVAPVNPR